MLTATLSPDAKLLQVAPTITEGQAALEYYLKTYVTFLQSAGYHVFFSLPSFGDEPEGRNIEINHSSVISREHLTMLGLTKVHDIELTAIKRYITTMWLKAAMMVGAQGDKLEDRITASIAEYSNAWTAHSGNLFFKLKFGHHGGNHPIRFGATGSQPCSHCLQFYSLACHVDL